MARRKKRAVDPERHGRNCTICGSPWRDRIEAEFTSWEPAASIIKRFRIKSRTTLYLHASALGLMQDRIRNVQALVSKIIEKNVSRKLNGASLVAAIHLLSKLDQDGRSAERFEIGTVSSFSGWTIAELRRYVENGVWPERFARQVHGGTE